MFTSDDSRSVYSPSIVLTCKLFLQILMTIATYSWIQYGSPTRSLVALTPTSVNSAAFGVYFSGWRTTTAVTYYIDDAEINVYYDRKR